MDGERALKTDRKIVAVCLSPAIDTTFYIDEMTDKVEYIHVDEEFSNASGKAPNLACALKNWGCKIPLHIVAGSQNVELYQSLLASQGMTAEFTLYPGRIRENITMVTRQKVQYKFNRTNTVEAYGWIAPLRGWLEREHVPGAIAVFCGSLPKGITPQQFMDLLMYAKGLGYELALDSPSLQYSQLVELSPLVVKPNREEMMLLWGLEAFPDDSGLGILLKRMMEDGIRNILLTLGHNGLILASGERFVSVGCGQPALSAHRVSRYRCTLEAYPVNNTVGAGDAALAGFLAGVTEGKDLDERAAYAFAFGTAKVWQEGTRMPVVQDIRKVLAAVEKI